jgi:hypothetical protein
MINDIKEYFRFKLYDNSRVLVNNLKDVIEEVQLFLDKKIYPYLQENDCRIVISNIELLNEDGKIIWRIIEKDEINNKETKELDIYNISEFIDNDYIKEIKELYEDYPKDLCGSSLISFIETIYYFIIKEEFITTMDVFGICMLSNNGNNNVVYEMQ